MAMPTAADTKFWTVNPSICVRWLIACSPENHCQFVFVTNDTAALNAPHGVVPGRFVGLKGSEPCSRMSA